jgi:hypothetical protein
VKRALLVGVVASSLALSACGGGSTPSSSGGNKKATFENSLASLGGSQDLQVTASVSFTGAGSAKVEKILKDLSFKLDFSNPSGGALSNSAGKTNVDIATTINGKKFLDLRVIDSNIYVYVNVPALSGMSGVSLPGQELSAVQLVFGGRWFKLPTSVINSFVPKKDGSKAKVAEDTSIEYKLVDAISKALDVANYKSLGNGSYSETGSLLSVETALLPVLNSVSHVTAPTGASAEGTYSLSITGSGTNANNATISITAPNGKLGNATAALTLKFAHTNDAVSVPSGATVISKSLLQELAAGG